MSTIPHFDASVNTRRTTTHPTAHPLAAQLAARLNAGAHERCASCLNWTDKKHTGAVAVYMPHAGRPHTGYVLCKRCAKLSTGTPDQQAELTKQVETYLDGSAH